MIQRCVVGACNKSDDTDRSRLANNAYTISFQLELCYTKSQMSINSTDENTP